MVDQTPESEQGEGRSGARILPRPFGPPIIERTRNYREPLTPPWLDAMHEKRDQLAKQLDGNLKQLKRVLDEARAFAKELEEVLEEIRTAGETYESKNEGREGREGRRGERGEAHGRADERGADCDPH